MPGDKEYRAEMRYILQQFLFYHMTDDQLIIMCRFLGKLDLLSHLTHVYRQSCDFARGLQLADNLLDMLDRKAGLITQDDRKRWEPDLIAFKLAMLDYSDMWSEYLSYFDSVFSRVQLDQMYTSKEIRIDLQHRYTVIQRKCNKAQQGKSTRHLCRTQQDQFTRQDIELYRRVTIDSFVSTIDYQLLWTSTDSDMF